MYKKLILRISNELGNQMFMYASAFAISKKLNRELLIDDETAFCSRKNISTYGLSNFMITAQVAPNELKFLNYYGYIKRKVLKKTDYLRKKKIFYTEHKGVNKISKYQEEVFKDIFDNNLFLEGHFETEKYFADFKNDIINQFKFLESNKYQKSPYFSDISKTNSVSICLRQNRFSEGNKNKEGNTKSTIYSGEQIEYINCALKYIKSKVKNPRFFLWSNDFTKIHDDSFSEKITRVIHDNEFCLNLDKRALDLYLLSKSKHHIVIPSTFNWWGAWLSENRNKVITRPSNSFFSSFKINNLDLWPDNWIIINK